MDKLSTFSLFLIFATCVTIIIFFVTWNNTFNELKNKYEKIADQKIEKADAIMERADIILTNIENGSLINNLIDEKVDKAQEKTTNTLRNILNTQL